jgi:hypothetical protein
MNVPPKEYTEWCYFHEKILGSRKDLQKGPSVRPLHYSLTAVMRRQN